MYKLIEIRVNPLTNMEHREFICDTDADFADLPNGNPGDTAVSAATGNVYIVNASGEWVLFGGGGGSDEPEYPAASEGLEFTLKDDGTYEVSDIGECTDLDVVIPQMVDGIAVTSIGSYAFLESSITSVTIPNSVATIGDGAFNDCWYLTSITIPDSVTSIGYMAFNGCSVLTSITIGNGITTIGECAFYSCGGLTSITIPDNVTSICDNAFDNCQALTSVTIGYSVTSIGNGGFSWCRNLNDITFNGTTTQWNSITFGENWNENVPATYVQCTDGQVAL